ncbi:MAG: SinR family protein [Deltaproteobacteria bacterium]
MAKLITYDLDNPGQNYKSLINAIQQYPSWTKITESCWLVSSQNDAGTIKSNLSKYVDANDRLMVADLKGQVSWKNTFTPDTELKSFIENK